MTTAAFPGDQPVLATRTDRAMLSVTRYRPAIPSGDAHLAKMNAEDAFVVLFQLRPHPAHEFISGGKLNRIGPVPGLTLNIVNLGDGDAGGRLRAPVDTMMVHLPRPALDEMADAAGGPKISVLRTPEPWRTRDPVFDRIHPLLLHALAGHEPGNALLYDHWLLGLAAHVAHRYGGMSPLERLARGGLAPWQEKRAKERLSANLGEPISLREIAADCHLSPDHLSRAFKASTGITPHRWLQTQRVDCAKTMLATTGLPIAEIARACGFSDQSHLSRVFSRLIGVSPGVWRRRQP